MNYERKPIIHLFNNGDILKSVIILETKNIKGKAIYEMIAWDRTTDRYERGQWLTGCILQMDKNFLFEDGYFYYTRKEGDGREFGVLCTPPYFTEQDKFGPIPNNMPKYYTLWKSNYTSFYKCFTSGILYDLFKHDKFTNVKPPIGYLKMAIPDLREPQCEEEDE